MNWLSKQILKRPQTPGKLRSITVLIYLAGVAGIAISFTREWFVMLIPFILLFSAGLIGYERLVIHRIAFSRNDVFFMVFVYVVSFSVELIGVNTGFPFGRYQYGTGLGFKVFGTPLIIGINWLLLVICSSALFEKINGIIFKVVLASLAMVGYDLVMEQVSCHMDIWCWTYRTAPMRNFEAWFVLAVFFHSIKAFLKISFPSSIARWIFFAQFGFFVSLYFYFIVLKAV